MRGTGGAAVPQSVSHFLVNLVCSRYSCLFTIAQVGSQTSPMPIVQICPNTLREFQRPLLHKKVGSEVSRSRIKACCGRSGPGLALVFGIRHSPSVAQTGTG